MKERGRRRKRLLGKSILITGGSQGLGRALAIDYAREGCKILAIVGRNLDALRKVEEEISHVSPETETLTISADLAVPQDLERIVGVTLSKTLGNLDVLVNNASSLGATPLPLLADFTDEDFVKVLQTNLIAPFVLTKKFLPSLIESMGSVINVTSDASRNAYPRWGGYGASKAALDMMTRIWAAELKELGVRVNSVDPGEMNTALHRAAEPDLDPKLWADPADVTDIFVYLASGESAGVTGKRLLAQSGEWMAQFLSPHRLTIRNRARRHE
jgi:NAD(P)-dependent dehydrogenase (short-subunit alcohol dehydrogenase family)